MWAWRGSWLFFILTYVEYLHTYYSTWYDTLGTLPSTHSMDIRVPEKALFSDITTVLVPIARCAEATFGHLPINRCQ